MVEDILDKIVVPDVKSTKADVFKKEERKKKEEYREEKYKEKEEKKEKPNYINEKKEIFRKGEFDTRKPVSFNIKTPGLIERSIYITVILILFYFAFFQNINFNFGNIFSGNVQPLVTKSIDNQSETKEEVVEEKTTEGTDNKEKGLRGDITLTIDDVKTEKLDNGFSKIKGFTFTIDNQKEEFDAKIIYYAYDLTMPIDWKTKSRGDITYVMPIGKTTKTIDMIIGSMASTKTLRVELYDGDKVIANITKEVTIS